MPSARDPRGAGEIVLDDPSDEAGATFIERYLQVSRRLESTRLRIWDIRMKPDLRIPRHEHAWAFFCAVIGGSLENSNAPAFRKNTLVFHPESHGHESAIGPDGAHILTVEMSRLWLDRVLEDDYRVPASARAVDLVRTRFGETLTLDDSSREVGVGPRRLAAWFHRTLGVTVGEFQRRLRVEFVLRRLSSRDRLVDIAANAGFADQAHCTRVFKRITDTTPGAYRLTGRKGRPDGREDRISVPVRGSGTIAGEAGTGRSRRDSRFR